MRRRMVVLAAVTLLLAGCSEQVVDGKAELPVPDTTAVCYLLEIDTESGGEEQDESYRCVPRDVWDQHEVGDTWAGTNGRR